MIIEKVLYLLITDHLVDKLIDKNKFTKVQSSGNKIILLIRPDTNIVNFGKTCKLNIKINYCSFGVFVVIVFFSTKLATLLVNRLERDGLESRYRCRK